MKSIADSVLIEAGSRFQCLPDCGFCCGFWDISVDEPRKEHLLQLRWVQEIESDLKTRKNQPLFPIVGQPNHSIIQRQHGTCSFINDQKLCSIHAREGMDAKPLSCQQYPFIYYRTPRGLEVLLDHSCPEIIKNLGDLVTVQEVERNLPHQHVLSVPEALPLSAGVNLNWDDYLQLEGALLGALQLDLSPADQILCLHLIAAELCRSLGGSGPTDSSRVRQALEAMTAEKLRFMLAGVRKLGGNASKRDLYLAILIQLVEATYSSRLRDDGTAQRPMFLRILKHWKGLGSESFEVFKLRVNHAQLKTIVWDAGSAQFREMIGRYLRYLVRSLLNTGRMPILKRLAIVSANYALIDWLARAHATQHGSSQVGLDDVVFGIQIVEKFMSNRLFNELASQRNFLARIVHSMFDNLALPPIMLAAC